VAACLERLLEAQLAEGPAPALEAVAAIEQELAQGEAQPDEVPPELREVFALEAEEHLRTIRLGELVRLVSELVIARSALGQRLTDFSRQVDELRSSTERVRQVSHTLETQYEARALGRRLGGAHGCPGGADGFDDLELDRYTEFHLLPRALAETTSDIQGVAGELGHALGDFDGQLERQARLAAEIEDKVMRLRMVPLATLAGRLQRRVRTVAEQLGKQVGLMLEGDGTELDRTVLGEMADPLLHLLRDAVCHGSEAPDLRQAAGKAPAGRVVLRAWHEGGQVLLEVSDDGAGLDPEAVRAAAVRRGLLSAAEAEQLTDDDSWVGAGVSAGLQHGGAGERGVGPRGGVGRGANPGPQAQAHGDAGLAARRVGSPSPSACP
jgi:chemosensory pili system protein ChpA (sensor histidine kinase/response regulator)